MKSNKHIAKNVQLKVKWRLTLLGLCSSIILLQAGYKRRIKIFHGYGFSFFVFEEPSHKTCILLINSLGTYRPETFQP